MSYTKGILYTKQRQDFKNVSLRLAQLRLGNESYPFPSSAVLVGGGDSSTPIESTETDQNFLGLWVKGSGASGTSRGLYLRLYLTGGAGGEAGRFYTTVSSNTPADTVNGVHASLSFGSSSGNVIGEGQAVRGTLHIPARALNGTVAALKAELWADSANSDVGGVMAFIRAVAGGVQGGIDQIDDHAFFMVVDGLTAGTGHILREAAPGTLAASLRVKVGATTYYLPLYAAPSA